MMFKLFLNSVLCFFIASQSFFSVGFAQDQGGSGYMDSIKQYRKNIIQEHIGDPRSPLTKKDVRKLRYFEADPEFRMICEYIELEKKDSVVMPTSSGRQKYFLKFAIAKFSIDDQSYTLYLYKSANATKSYPGYFLPFYDQTNGTETYGGGRYLELDSSHFENASLIIDFNKAYNPWCAYSDGFNCPVPPEENRLPLEILAGEKMYRGKHKNGSKSK